MPLNLLVCAVASVVALGPPPASVEPVVETLHGVEFVDDYRWLETLEAESEAVEAWTTEQNDYTRGILDRLPGRAALETRLAQLMNVDSISSPSMRRNLYFYTVRTGDQNQRVVYVREGEDGSRRQLLDPNTLDENGLSEATIVLRDAGANTTCETTDVAFTIGDGPGEVDRNSIAIADPTSFSEVFTVAAQAPGTQQMVCFWVETADTAVGVDGVAEPNRSASAVQTVIDWN